MLSSKRYPIDQMADDQIAGIFELARDTISRWLDNWEERGFNGLPGKARSGRLGTLDLEQEDRACAIALEEPRQIKLGVARLEEGRPLG